MHPSPERLAGLAQFKVPEDALGDALLHAQSENPEADAGADALVTGEG